MFWLVVFVIVMIGAFFTRVMYGNRIHYDWGDFVITSVIGFFAGLILTGVISLCLGHSAPTILVNTIDADLVEIAENVYGYESNTNNSYCDVYYEDENGFIQSYNVYKDNLLYSNTKTPHIYYTEYDYADEVLRVLLWKCDCDTTKNIIVPSAGSIIERPD